MTNKTPLFILAGNGPYDNRGCEAIVRGTVEILRHYFDKPRFVVVSIYQSNSQIERQRANETDKAIIHKKNINARKRFEPLWFLENSLRFLYPKWKRYITYREMLPYLKEAMAVLSIGGDNYSLDYGIPRGFTDLDNLVLSKNKPMIIWGASVGPFGKIPKYERFMVEHLKKVTGIFARESATIEYLANKGVTKNVYRVADPAFLLKPIRAAYHKFNGEILKEAIGINLSPLMAKYITDGYLKKWIEYSADIIKEISIKIKRPIYLIPHVTGSHTNNNDYEFLKEVLSVVGKQKEKIDLIPSNLTAAEIKWVISKMSVFAGARTHSTIAALSCGVPTISFAYSIKAKGINKDIFGHNRFCIEPDKLTPTKVSEKICELLQESEKIKNQISLALPKVKNLAMDAGRYLKAIIGKS